MEATIHTSRGILDTPNPLPPVAGTIRTGIMVLTSSARQKSGAIEIYEKGIAADKSYDTIGRELKTAFQTDKSMLTPRNTPYFRVSPRDFTNPALARQIFELYAEDRGGGLGKQLYQFPIVLAYDDWLKNMPHGLTSFTGSELKYQSQYDSEGTRFCMMHAAAEVHRHNQRAVRAWGGRKLVLRAENEGRCVPEACPEYQCKACKLSGRLLFYIPGVPGSSLIELNTTSFYSMDQMRASMAQVARVRMGKISGLHDDKAFLYLTKVEEEVSMLDEQGKPKKADQFLVKMETTLPMVELMQRAAQVYLAAPAAAPVLEAPKGTIIEHGAPATESGGDGAPEDPPIKSTGDPERDRVLRLRAKISGILASRGKDTKEFGDAMRAKHGPNAMTDAGTLSTILFELETDQ